MGLKRLVNDDTDMETSPVCKRRLCSSRELDAEARPQVCDVCLELSAGGGGVRLGACGHHMCGSCAAAWCASAAARCLQQGAPPRCALPRCGRAVPPQQARQLLQGAGVALGPALYGAAYEAAALIPEEAQFTCPYPDCGVMSELEAALPDAPTGCPACGRGVCPSCRCMWHSGLRCSQYQALGGGGAADKRCRVIWRRAERRPALLQQQQLPFAAQQAQQQQTGGWPGGARQAAGGQGGAPPASPMSP